MADDFEFLADPDRLRASEALILAEGFQARLANSAWTITEHREESITRGVQNGGLLYAGSKKVVPHRR